MKLHLYNGNNDSVAEIPDFKNIKFSLYSFLEDEDYIPNSHEVIVLSNVINNVPIHLLPELLSKLEGMTRAGGLVVIRGTDCRVISTLLHNDSLNIQQYNSILFGQNQTLGFYDKEFIAEVLNSCGLQVRNIEITGYLNCEYVIKAQRS